MIRRRRTDQRLVEHFTFTMSSEMLDRLSREAERRKISMSSLVREAIDQLFKSCEVAA